MSDGGSGSTDGRLALGGQTIVGVSPPMKLAVERACALVAAAAMGVLLLGEAGTGKELLARGIHYAAAPYDPFLPFDCAAVPEPLLGAELFGTHPSLMADGPPPRRGLTELAGAGTLLVADVTRLPPLRERPADIRLLADLFCALPAAGACLRPRSRTHSRASVPGLPKSAQRGTIGGLGARTRVDAPGLGCIESAKREVREG